MNKQTKPIYKGDEILEVMHEDDSIDTFPAETENVESGEEMLSYQEVLVDKGLVEWTEIERMYEGRIFEEGCYQLSEKGLEYIRRKRKARLDRFTLRRLTEKEIEYVEATLDFTLKPADI